MPRPPFSRNIHISNLTGNLSAQRRHHRGLAGKPGVGPGNLENVQITAAEGALSIRNWHSAFN